MNDTQKAEYFKFKVHENKIKIPANFEAGYGPQNCGPKIPKLFF